MEVHERGLLSAVTRLRLGADTERMQRLMERCSDYYELHEGWPTPPDAAEYELSTVPEGRDVADLHVLGMEDDAGELQGMAELMSDYPAPGTWWIAGLMVAPPVRSRGIGSQLLQHAIDYMRARGARSVRLAVSTKNPRGQAFWEAAGFHDDQQLRQVRARNGHVDEVRMFSREL